MCNPVFHLSGINHKFAEQYLIYCLLKQLNEEQFSNMTTDKIVSFHISLKTKLNVDYYLRKTTYLRTTRVEEISFARCLSYMSVTGPTVMSTVMLLIETMIKYH